LLRATDKTTCRRSGPMPGSLVCPKCMCCACGRWSYSMSVAACKGGKIPSHGRVGGEMSLCDESSPQSLPFNYRDAVNAHATPFYPPKRHKCCCTTM